MKQINPYENCPIYETNSFVLRIVSLEDAQDLLECYSDKTAVSRVNADNCINDFYCETLEQMKSCITFWLSSYKEKDFVRFAIVDKASQRTVGTVEIFGGEYGCLRIDIATDFDKLQYIEEIYQLSMNSFVTDFKIGTLVVKANNTPDRIPCLEKYGFTLSERFRSGKGYYERCRNNFFSREKGVAYCGLACCVCSENISCVGCRNEGCKDREWCKSFNCCKEKKLSGCWECSEFPCQNQMLDKLRVRTFAKFIAEHGEEELIDILKNNEIKGLKYHYEGQLIGDYDMPKTEDDLMRMLLGER